MDIIYIILAVLVVVILIILLKYNQLIKLLNKVKKAKANIEIYLNKRFELIPNLVECVKSYSNYEGGTLEDIVALRNNYNNHNNLKEAEKINNDFNKYLAIVENYPNLKSNTQYINLQNQLSIIENELQNARRMYNEEVTRYNTLIETVSSNIVASIFAFKKAELFQIEDYKRDNVKLDL